jgi:hypothetical protein
MSNELDQKTVTCPECGAQIDVNKILYHQVEEGLRKSFDSKLEKERKNFEEMANALEKEKKSLEEQQKTLEEKIQAGVKKQVQSEKLKLEAQIRQTVADENADALKSMEEELKRKSDQVKELNKLKTDFTRLEREKNELRESIEAEAQKKISDTLNEERGKIQKTAEERVQLKINEKDKVIDDLNQQLKDAQRKAEQGSMQLQGEVQELAIEKWLRESFPLDTIDEVKKGARGADCLQVVNTQTRQNCGSIYYESKRTKCFQPGWIEKFKQDMRACGATIGVIVTDAMPKDMERMGLKDGVWICSFEEFKGLCAVLRESIIHISNSAVAQENKGEKMNMLYSYLTSNEFKMQIEAIVEGFTQMQTDLNSEKRTMESAWKKREKQIDKVLLNTNHLYSSIRGIAGSAIPVVSQLEFEGTAEIDGPPNTCLPGAAEED